MKTKIRPVSTWLGSDQENTLIMKNVHPGYMLALDTRFAALKQNMFKANNMPFFKSYESMIQEFEKTWIILGEVFNESCQVLLYGTFFKKFLKISRDKAIQIGVSTAVPLKEYVYEHAWDATNDAAIQSAAGSRFMTEQEWWFILYALVIKPELGKTHLNYELDKSRKHERYVFHVQTDDKQLKSFLITWHNNIGWFVEMNEFNTGNVPPNSALLFYTRITDKCFRTFGLIQGFFFIVKNIASLYSIRTYPAPKPIGRVLKLTIIHKAD